MDSLSGRCHPRRTGLLLSRRNFSLWSTGISLSLLEKMSAREDRLPFWINVSTEDWTGKPFCRITATEDWTPFLLETVSQGGLDSLSVGDCQPRRSGLPFCWRMSATEEWTPFLLENVSHGGLDFLSLGTVSHGGLDFLSLGDCHGGMNPFSFRECQPRRTGLPFCWRLSAPDDAGV